MTLFGIGATGGKYAAIAALTNLFATPLSCVIYDFAFGDAARGAQSPPYFVVWESMILTGSIFVVMTPSHKDFWLAHRAHAELRDEGTVEFRRDSQEVIGTPVKEKQDIQHIS